MNDFITYLDLADELGLQENNLYYHARLNRIPKPQRVFGRRVYDQETAEEIRRYFNTRKKGQHAPRTNTNKEDN